MNTLAVFEKFSRKSLIQPISVTKKPLTYLNSFEIEYRTKSGALKKWELVSRGDLKRVEEEIFHSASFSDGAMIAAVDKERTHIVLLREYRVSQGRYVYALPAGLMDPGETIEEAAAREFLEETGLHLEIASVSKERYASVGIIDEKVTMVYGYYSGTPSKEHQSDQEDADILLVDREMAIYLLKYEEVPIRTTLVLEHFFKLNPFLSL